MRKGSAKRRVIGLYKYMKNNSNMYDIVLANFNTTAIAVFLGSSVNNFYYIQAYEPGLYTANSIKSLLQKFIAWITYLLPLTRIVNAEIYKKYKNIRSKYVIHPGLDLTIYYPKDLICEKKKELIVGCIGRKEEWKGSNDVGEAIKILHERGYSVTLKVAFNPVDYTKHDLVFPDGDSNLAEFYRSLDVLVAPGHIQLGAVHYPVIEAMACNVPVITTGYYPANETNAFIIPPKSPKKIAEVLEQIINDYSITINKANAANQLVKQFDWQFVSQKFINIFWEAIKRENTIKRS